MEGVAKIARRVTTSALRDRAVRACVRFYGPERRSRRPGKDFLEDVRRSPRDRAPKCEIGVRCTLAFLVPLLRRRFPVFHALMRIVPMAESPLFSSFSPRVSGFPSDNRQHEHFWFRIHVD